MAETSYPHAAKLLAYVQGSLSSAEAAEIEAMIASDAGFAAEVEEMRLFAQGQGEKAVEALQSHQRNIGEAIRSTSRARPLSGRFPWMSLAAVIVVLMAFGAWWLNSSQQEITPSDLLAWEEASVTRGFDDERWQQVLAPGSQGDYALAVDSLKSWLLTYPGDTEARLYLGRALALAGRQMEAQNLFFTIENDEMRLPKERLDAKWYRAVMGVKEGQNEKACELLNEIEEQLGKRRKKQTQLLMKKHCENN